MEGKNHSVLQNGQKQKRTAGDHLCGIYDNSAVIAVCIYLSAFAEMVKFSFIR